MFEAFSNLNIRFENLLNDPTLPIRIDLSLVSKSTFQWYYEQIIIPYQHRIKSLDLSNLLIINRIFSSNSIVSKFTRLENLNLYFTEPQYLEQVIIHLNSLSCLYSLTIYCIDDVQNKVALYQQIFRLPILDYLKLSLTEYGKSNSLPITTTEFSSIKYLTICNCLYTDELNALLSYIPQIRRLSIGQLRKSSKTEIANLHSITMNHLKHLSMGKTDITFNEFELIMKNFFQQIQILYMSTKDDLNYIDANRWERLIQSHLPNLRIFDIQSCYSSDKVHDQFFMNQFNKFNSVFWLERKWFFGYHFYHDKVGNIIFFSTNPYR